METIGKYQVRQVLGRGSVGVVYEAFDPGADRMVALKVISADQLPKSALRARFLEEARKAGALGHPNLVTVFEGGEEDDTSFLAMELVAGVDLEHVIRSGRAFPVEWTLDVLRQIGEGLGQAHRHGLLHRDLKPSDIRVTPEGDVKILDFGIACLKSFDRLESGPARGGVFYRAPEVIEGRRPDARADLYSVGAIVYELLSGRKPFLAGDLATVMFKITHEAPDANALPASSFSPGLEAIVMKALARRREERHHSLEEMREELVRLVRETAPRLLGGASTAAEGQAPSPETDPAPSAEQAKPLAEETKPVASEATTPAGEVTPPAETDSGSSEEASRPAVAGAPRPAATEAPHLAVAEAPHAAVVEASEPAVAQAPQPAVAGAPHPSVEEVRVQILQARAEGRWSTALELCHRALERDPEDEFARRNASEIETAAQERDVEQLCGLALSYAADGEVELAARITEKVERLAPWSPKYLQLQVYLDEETAKRAGRKVKAAEEPPTPPSSTEAPPAVAPPAVTPRAFTPRAFTRREVEALTSAALNHFVRSEHGQARKAVEKALALDPRDRKARELLKILGTIP